LTFTDQGTVGRLFARLNATKKRTSRSFFMAPELGVLLATELSEVERDNLTAHVREVCEAATGSTTTNLFLPAPNPGTEPFRIHFPVYENGSWALWVLVGPQEYPAAKAQRYAYSSMPMESQTPAANNIGDNLDALAEGLLSTEFEPRQQAVQHTPILRQAHDDQDSGLLMCIHGTQLAKVSPLLDVFSLTPASCSLLRAMACPARTPRSEGPTNGSRK
jgi:hypothetical protein